jgi:death-on-curing family protein
MEGTRDPAFLVLFEKHIKPSLEGEDIHHIAARILYELVQKHPFWDGNKRTAFTTSMTVLTMGNRSLEVEDETVETYVLDLATRFERVEKGELPADEIPKVEDVEKWFEENSCGVPARYYLGLFLGIVVDVSLVGASTPIYVLRRGFEKVINRLQGA